MGENIYMLPSDMNLKIKTGTVGYNNKILVSDEKFSLEKNDEVDAMKLATMKSHKNSKTNSLEPTTQGLAQKPNISHKDEEIALVLFLTGGFAMWFMFR